MSEIFIKLLNMSISASWLVLSVVILRLLLKRSPKWIACILWAMVAVRLLCPFSLESVLSLIPSAETVPEEIIYSESPEIDSGIPIINTTVNPIISEGLAPKEKAEANPMEIITGVASVVWAVGAAAMAVYALVSYIRIRKRVSEAVREGDGVWICDRVDTPFIIGLFAPRIILPSDLTGTDREYVISHERAHLSRMDHIWKPLGFALLTVYWFNPLMWLAYILLCRDIEAACDEKVIKKLGEEAKKPYAEALVNCSVPKRMISACPLAFGESGVKERVRNVLNYKKPAFWIIVVAIVACIVVAVCFLTNPKEDKEKTPDGDDNAVVDVDTTDDETTADTIEEKYNIAKAALTTLDETKKKEILNTYSYGRISWYDIDSKNSRTGDGMRCYGEFESCIVLFESTDATVRKTKKIADSEFTHSSSFALYAYHDNCLYSLEEAYDKGLISSDDVETAAKRHRIVEDYLISLRKVDNTTENETTKSHEDTTGVPEETTGVPEETTAKPIETKPPSVPADTTGKQNSKPKDTTKDTTASKPVTTLKAPSDQLLDLIESDYYAYNKKSNSEADYYHIERYYGEYSGSIAIIFRIPITGTVSLKDVRIWENGKFFTMDEAYKQDVLTKDELDTIEEIHMQVKYLTFNRYGNNASVENPDKTLDERYNEAKKALTVLDEATKDKLSKAMGIKWNWLDYDSLQPESVPISTACCYGEFDGCVVVFEPNVLCVETTINVANSTFYDSSGFNIFVLYNDTLYTINEAYDNGFISAENVEKAAVNHKIIQDYCSYCIKLKYS